MNSTSNRFFLRMRPVALSALAVCLLALAAAQIVVDAKAPVDDSFTGVWERADLPVATGRVQRSWLWGPEALTAPQMEEYAEAPNGQRLVQYFDKSRMEITNPNADPDDQWYVTNGLLVVELVTGRLQLGHAEFSDHAPAQIGVGGDPDDTTGPTYETFRALMNAPAYDLGATITMHVNRNGDLTNEPSLAEYGVTAAQRIETDGLDHMVASPFWEFMNAEGLVYEDGQYVTGNLLGDWLYTIGYPIAEAYWADVKIAGVVQQEVLIQCFERRCLTYTPSNDPAWQVEAGNVGQHYLRWRDSLDTTEPTPEPTQTVTPGSTETPANTATASSTATRTPEPTNTPRPTRTPTATQEPTNTPNPSATATPDPNPPFESGRARKTPWSGHWWPFQQGAGLNLYSPGGPLDQYDKYVAATRGTAPGARDWEERNQSGGAAWWGYCYAWAAASIMEPEPSAVSKAGVTFSQDDVEGLLTAGWSRPSQKLWGSESQLITPAEFDSAIRDYIGKQSKNLIIDLDPGDQIWNYPIYAYEREVETTGGRSEVTMTLTIAVPVLGRTGTDSDSVTFTYTLSSNGPGQWTGYSASDPPNFLWAVTGRGTTINPYVNYSIIKEISN